MKAKALLFSFVFFLNGCIMPSIDHPMESMEAAHRFLNKQENVAIWYTQYEGRDEAIYYANGCFSEIFGIPVDEILKKKRYHLVNPPDTPQEVIERYKDEDRTAMRDGSFLSRGPFETGKDIVVVKLRFDRGMLGLFKLVDSKPGNDRITLQNLDGEILDVVRGMRLEHLIMGGEQWSMDN